MLQHFLGKAVDDQRHRFFLAQATLHRIEKLVVGNLACGRLMLDLRAGIADLDIGHGMRAAFVTEQQAIALGKIAHAIGIGCHAHQPAIGVVAFSGADALGNDRTARPLAIVDHLGAGIGLLVIVRDRDRIKFADAVFAVQDAAGIFPSDSTAGFNLCPANLAVTPLAERALGHKIVDPSAPFCIAGIPVLYGAVLDLRIVQCNQFNDGCVQLVFIAHRRGAAFEIADVRALVGDDQGALKLPGILCIYAEICAQLHRAADALGDVDKGAIAEDRAVQCRKIIVVHRHNLAEPLLHELRIFLDRLADRSENYPSAFQLGAKGRRNRNRVKHRINRNLARTLYSGKDLLFFNGNTELFVNPQNLRIDLI